MSLRSSLETRMGIYAADLIPHKCSTSRLSTPSPYLFSVICNVMSSFLRFNCNIFMPLTFQFKQSCNNPETSARSFCDLFI